MRTVTVEANQIVIRDCGVTVRYDLAIVQKRLKNLESELETWREYERLLTPDAADLPCGFPGCGDIGWNGGFCRLHNPANSANR